MGQPKKMVDYKVLNALLQFKVTLDFCADHLGMSRDSIMRRIKEDHGMSFTEYHALKMQHTATKLQQKAIEMALKGNTTMMIFALKNIAKWSDKVDETVTQKLQIHIDKEDARV